MICANRLKAEREVGSSRVGEALSSGTGALAANQETIPCLVAAVALDWLPIEEVNAISHHHGATGADISHGDRTL